MSDCIFCKIISGEIPSSIVYEDEATVCIMDVRPLTRGHVLIIPKKHAVTLGDMDDEGLASVMSTIRKMVQPLISVLKPDGYNVFQNNGRAAGQVVDHVHFHLVPRHKKDGAIKPKSKPSADPDELKKLAEEFQAALQI